MFVPLWFVNDEDRCRVEVLFVLKNCARRKAVVWCASTVVLLRVRQPRLICTPMRRGWGRTTPPLHPPMWRPTTSWPPPACRPRQSCLPSPLTASGAGKHVTTSFHFCTPQPFGYTFYVYSHFASFLSISYK